MPLIYNDGTLYNEGEYGLISSGVAAAQLANVRSTGLKVSIIDERVNRWEVVNNIGSISPSTFTEEAIAQGDNDTSEPGYWAYRGFAHVAQLSGGTIVRVRVGSPGNYSDRQVYYQEVTDPTNASQWQSWTLLYSGTHYAAVVVPTGASTYDVYHTKAGVGFCKNNSVLDATASDGADLGRGIRIGVVSTPSGILNNHFTITVPTDYPHDAKRVLNFYINKGDSNTTPSADNFFWTRNSLQVIEDPNDVNSWLYYRSFQLHENPRLLENGESITVTRVTPNSIDELVEPPYLIRGLANQAGHNIITLNSVYKANDGYLYMFYGEFHTDDDFTAIQSSTFIFWQRSKDGIHWSEPVLVGYSINGFAGLFEHGGYMYLCGNGTVIRRPTTPVTHVLDDYVPRVNWEMPRNNEPASGSVIVANPGQINDPILELSDRRVVIEPGIKTAAGQFEFVQMSDLWASKIDQETEAAASRISIKLGDVWSRLEQPLRDTFNIVGRTDYSDWSAGNNNELFNYYFPDSADAEVVSEQMRLPTGGTAIWTGWKGHNPEFKITFISSALRHFYIRYVDENNHIRFDYNGTNLVCYVVRNGTATQAQTDSVPGRTILRFVVKWHKIWVYSNTGSLLATIDLTLDDPIIQPGYVGWGADGDVTFSSLTFTDWEAHIDSHDIVKFALAMGDYHDVIVGGPANPQYALIWGPQTDIPTAADGLRQVLTAEKLELVWRDGFIQVGQFKNITPVMILEDRIIETTFRDEANRRINLAIVDGNEHSWFAADAADTRQRDRQIVGYYDLPELMTQEAVRLRAEEEIRVGNKGQSPGGTTPLFFDLRRMDAVTWIDNLGRQYDVRIEGISISINQSSNPRQNMQLDTSLL